MDDNSYIRKVRTRIAPSPTGNPHIGTIYQALFDYVFAKKYDGSFVVRIEDTDRTRFIEGAEDEVLNALEWFKLIPDESPKITKGNFGPYRQSERKNLGIYNKFLFGGIYDNAEYTGLINLPLPMIENQDFDKSVQLNYCAYLCFCKKDRLDKLREEQQSKKIVPHYDKLCANLLRNDVLDRMKDEEFVVRLNVPSHVDIIFNDWLLGEIKVSSKDVDDQVLLKSDGYPTYHYAVVVDDQLMKITHVFRGREWLPSAPKHIILHNYLNHYYQDWERPIYIHLPVILNMDGKGKLSKRHGHSSVNYYKELGYLPEAILNYLSNIVWNHPDNLEIYDIEKFKDAFHFNKIRGVKTIYSNTNEIMSSLTQFEDYKIDIGSQGPRFDLDKLTWVNQQWIMQIANKNVHDLTARLREFYKEDNQVLKVLHDDELAELFVRLASTRMKTLKEFKELLLESHVSPRSDLEKEIANTLKNKLHVISEEDWNKDSIFASLKETMHEHTIKMPVLYYIFTGKERGLPLPETLEGLQKETTLERLDQFMK